MNLYVKKQYKENKFLSSYYSIFNKYKTNNEYFHEIFKFGQYNLKYIKYKHIEISLQINFNDYFSGFLTLYTLMINNNWNYVVEIYYFITDG